jgi:hypothetical protein
MITNNTSTNITISLKLLFILLINFSLINFFHCHNLSYNF